MARVGMRRILKGAHQSHQQKLRRIPHLPLARQGVLVTKRREYEKKLYYRFISIGSTVYYRVGAEYIDQHHGPKLTALARGMAS